MIALKYSSTWHNAVGAEVAGDVVASSKTLKWNHTPTFRTNLGQAHIQKAVSATTGKLQQSLLREIAAATAVLLHVWWWQCAMMHGACIKLKSDFAVDNPEPRQLCDKSLSHWTQGLEDGVRFWVEANTAKADTEENRVGGRKKKWEWRFFILFRKVICIQYQV